LQKFWILWQNFRNIQSLLPKYSWNIPWNIDEMFGAATLVRTPLSPLSSLSPLSLSTSLDCVVCCLYISENHVTDYFKKNPLDSCFRRPKVSIITTNRWGTRRWRRLYMAAVLLHLVLSMIKLGFLGLSINRLIKQFITSFFPYLQRLDG